MADFIRREDALKVLCNNYAYAAMDVIKRLPAADVAEVVRCKYCRHLGAPLSGGCYDCKKYMLPYCRPDDFCSHGEYQTNTGGSNNVAD
jgi:hypothetical protein|nr:MAG TPA: hypothetical protein [Caudoviricetes sp.]DAR26024.1 MAG TPA: hypothetical protein [Caudoviricetes sp.]